MRWEECPDWILSAVIDTNYGESEQGNVWGLEEGSTLPRRNLEVRGNCLEGEQGNEAGEKREEVRCLKRTGEREGKEVGWVASSTVSTSGRGTRVKLDEEPEEIPDIAEGE